MISARVWGGAGEHGRSCYCIQFRNDAVLLDCGVKKGKQQDHYPLMDEAMIGELSAVVLSHAHEDHSAAIPLLYRMGFGGEVWTTRATAGQLPHYYARWQRTERGATGVNAYADEHISQVRYRFMEEEAEPGRWLAVKDGLELCWGPSGHMIGGVWTMLRQAGEIVFYSGDFCQQSRLLEWSFPQLPCEEAIALAIVDAAYGDDKREQEQLVGELAASCRGVLQGGGHVWLPVPLQGRGHEFIHLLAQHLPESELICDEGLEAGYQALLQERRWLWPEAARQLESVWRERLRVMPAEGMLCRARQGKGAIFLTSDPLLQSPGSRQLLEALQENDKHAVLLTGHVYAGTLVSELLAHPAPAIQVLQCSYKVHQGLPDVRRMLDALQPVNTLLVHGDKGKTDRLQTELQACGYHGLISCRPGREIRHTQLS
ncbi:MBL fold metallo-hydrolase [Paenibacillus sp. J5C_2022]|uniref:MBL fold metallo-hydrolase n=1 Tax=Paenibacillus sp. J5C2022 TaxID=2977129 RepID=UPI0021D13748|nr:MBL fold metallo-hydrolase [Paenibacillus sp. J5C2022]MCU6708659.1 MBL fold metallo-hydrolase [Paenibacillus sp. J5C2022]